MRYPLSKKQSKLYDFIRLYIKGKNTSPTYLEMSEHMYGKNKKGLGGIAAFLKILEERGYICSIRNKQRSISITPDVRDELSSLRAVKAAAQTFIQVQENLRHAFDENPADPKNTEERMPKVAKAFSQLKDVAI